MNSLINKYESLLNEFDEVAPDYLCCDEELRKCQASDISICHPYAVKMQQSIERAIKKSSLPLTCANIAFSKGKKILCQIENLTPALATEAERLKIDSSQLFQFSKTGRNIFGVRAILSRLKTSLLEKQTETSTINSNRSAQPEIIEIDLQNFNDGRSKQLLQDLISYPKGVQYSEERHGRKQPKTLKERLKANGYIETVKHLHKYKNRIFVDTEVKIIAENNTP